MLFDAINARNARKPHEGSCGRRCWRSLIQTLQVGGMVGYVCENKCTAGGIVAYQSLLYIVTIIRCVRFVPARR